MSKKLSKKLSVPAISSDDIIFDKIWKKRNLEDVDKQLKFFSKNKSWVFEGVSPIRLIEKMNKSFDVLILLDYPKKLIFGRIFSRFKEGWRNESDYGKLRSLFGRVFDLARYSPRENLKFVKKFKDREIRTFVLKTKGDEVRFFKTTCLSTV